MNKIEVTHCISKFAELVMIVGSKTEVHAKIVDNTTKIRAKAYADPYLELEVYIPETNKRRTVRFLNDPPFFAILGESEEIDEEKPVLADKHVAHVSL
jgi:hypothetical protein